MSDEVAESLELEIPSPDPEETETKSERAGVLDKLLTAAKVFAAIATALVAVLSYTHALEKDAEARDKEAENRSLELAEPFVELRQARYGEAIKQAAVLSDPQNHTPAEIAAAKKRFRELYIAELSMVEAPDVEHKMVALAEQVDPTLRPLTPAQCAAYELAHALRDSFTTIYKISDPKPASKSSVCQSQDNATAFKQRLIEVPNTVK
jgi:hypothetical protein